MNKQNKKNAPISNKDGHRSCERTTFLIKMVSFRKKRTIDKQLGLLKKTIVLKKWTKKTNDLKLFERCWSFMNNFVLNKQILWFYWTNNFTERLFSKKTNVVDGKCTIILRLNKINFFLNHWKKWIVYDWTINGRKEKSGMRPFLATYFFSSDRGVLIENI